MRREAKRELYASDSRGIYIPQHFAESVVRGAVTGVSEEDFVVLLAGPDHEQYWDVWDSVLNNAVVTYTDGTVYRLQQDGDLWLIESAAEYDEAEDNYYVEDVTNVEAS